MVDSESIIGIATKKNLPPGAKILTRGEALQYWYEKIYHHQPLSDVFSLRFGGVLAGALSSVSGLLMLRHFRKGLGLRKEASISSNVASIFLPSIGTFVYHFVFITPPIILEEPHCSLCLELRTAAIQTFSGFAFPYAVGIISASMTASKLGSHVPTLAHPRELAKLSFFLAKKNNGQSKFAGILFLNILGAIFLVQAEEIQLVTFKRRLAIRKEIVEN